MKTSLQHSLFVLTLLLLTTLGASAQMKVGNNPTTINANSLLELESTNKGLLLPRLALTSTTAVSPLTAHVAGMSVYNTATAGDVVPGYYYNDGTKWVQLGPANNEPWYDVATLTPATSVTQNIYQLGAQTGLGTSTPAQRLDIVTTNTNADNIHLTSIGSNPSPTLRMRSAEGTIAAPGFVAQGTTIGSVIMAASTGAVNGFSDLSSVRAVTTQNHSATGLGTRLDFFTTPNGSSGNNGSNPQMTIDQSGFVGISTTVPNAQLSLGQTFVSPANSVTTTGTYRKITLQQNPNDEYGIGITAGSVDIYRSLGSSTASAEVMVRLGQHNGGGNISYQAFYPASDNVLALGRGPNRWSTVYAGTGVFTGSVTAASYATASDRRLKQNIRPLGNALARVDQLQGVTYTHTAKAIADRKLPAGKQIGFIAQELETVFPEFVITSPDGYKAVDYSRLTPVLVEAIKELKAGSDVMKAKNASLAMQVASLKAGMQQLAALTRQVNQMQVALGVKPGKISPAVTVAAPKSPPGRRVCQCGTIQNK